MKSTSTCGCSPDNFCDSSIAELPRYYPRQLITPDDLTLEQDYFRDRMRRHNRLLHGWGVVCGALVCPVPTPPGSDSNAPMFVPWTVQVQKGYILGPYGDEIILDCVRTIDLRTSGVSGVTGDVCVDSPDPWCSQVFNPPQTTSLYIAVKYNQCMTRPVRVQPVGCGCSDTSCEYSRWRDGYEIGVLTECPPCTGSTNMPTVGYNSDGSPELNLLAEGEIPDCPDCQCGPWAGLAAVTVDADGTVKQIDNCSCRRLVLSFSQFWWMCACAAPTITAANPSTVNADGNDVDIVVTGQNFRCGVTFAADPLLIKNTTWQDAKTAKLTINAPLGTPAKQYDLTATNLNGTHATKTAITVVAAAASKVDAPAKRPARPVPKP
jgi:hypothetical protein